jgi:hypothetical protein
MASTTTNNFKKQNTKVSFNGKTFGWVIVKYITYQFDDDESCEGHKVLECLDSSSIMKNALSDPSPEQSGNIREILFTLDSTFLIYEARDKLGDTINLQYIPIKYVIDVDIWREDFNVPDVKELSKQTRHSLK